MFSENEIAIQCRQCKGHCDEFKKCPLKIEWPAEKANTIIPAMPGKWKLSGMGKCVYMPASDKYTTEELITGLNRLSSHL